MFQVGNTRDATYARGPLGRPPRPSMGYMREESLIDSSFGPIRLAERSHIHGGDDFDTYLLVPHPHNGHASSCSIDASRLWRRHTLPTTLMF